MCTQRSTRQPQSEGSVSCVRGKRGEGGAIAYGDKSFGVTHAIIGPFSDELVTYKKSRDNSRQNHTTAGTTITE